ncbi:G-type lectin S-receptor-like serine/threonine-protein kinase At1g11410 [Juglans microcarpa x Juglans regia]|uniref:G-type lectin S-receptor-like serine/threonine-protein kinase At1g11410 n=1 Tax=Juglans microcarpa x Juglans regia TaxID=2249226 RepID=UPI001B7DD69A|nr:G-type lectin S-receptor-like serine/threonine-protein kinase At1g11410 [Juglans microcarpa x Juglans regia]
MYSPSKQLLTPLLLLSLLFQICVSLDTITPDEPLKDGDILVSHGETFALGFFSPVNSSRRYVGIWYNKVQVQTVVWVANRDHPLDDTAGILSIDGHGNLVLIETNRSIPIWSTNASVVSANRSIARLLDTGNLVLVHPETQSPIWQSFDFPTDTLLPFMKLGLDRRTGLKRFLTSWKSKDDPGTGNSTYAIDPTGYPQLFLYEGGAPLWRAGSWTGKRWSGVPEMTQNYIYNVSYVDNQDEITIEYGVTVPNVFIRLMVEEPGVVERSTWFETGWRRFWSAPNEKCDYYHECGPNSYCDPNKVEKFECTCLPGFEPKSARDWFLRDGSGGCVRNVSTCNSGEGFVQLARVKVPDTSIARANMSLSLKECEQECLNNCTCTAYTNTNETKGGIGCLTWHGNLVDTRVYTNGGRYLYLRVDAATLAQYAKKNGLLQNKKKLAILVVAVALMLLIVAFIMYWFIMRKIKKKRQNKYTFSVTSAGANFEESSTRRELDGSTRNSDLQFFELSKIVAATDNFSVSNKLGEGGFGSVYKGCLYNGKEIAVKKLSKYSGQGIEEFKNEVAIIAKLQHRNLVRILGYCVQGEEKMLIYEYLPNRSLDTFIFDETKRSLLDWGKCFDIICGIARGIIYLHQDSRLRIIHRDLKASNVLLDNAMHPKIADFGMARIVGGESGDQIEANTNRVVGTYGYMSPEYAMRGLFSVKSDVYSFGVLLLEIIYGKRNTTYFHDDPSSNLIGHVWELWKEGKAMEIVDSSLVDETPNNEVARCIQIGLLCVQEYATDRPNMSAVFAMLGNDRPLPSPQQPAFVLKGRNHQKDTSTSEGAISVNEVTVSLIHGR